MLFPYQGGYMNLRDWLVDHEIKHADFCEMTDMSTCYLSLICCGKQIPGKRLAKRIEKATGGDVKAEDILSGAALGYEGKPKRVPWIRRKKKDLPKNQ